MTERPRDFQPVRDAPLLHELAASVGSALDASAADRLVKYLELAVVWNRKLDLTAARTHHAQLEVLLADALVLADPALVPEGARVVDVGSGAGAPGLVLALARPDLQLTLVEPLAKRVAFLRTVIGKLGCAPRVSVVSAKLDPTAPQVPGAPFDVALSRATFPPEVWVPLGLTLAPRVLALLAAQSAPDAPEGSAIADTRDYQLLWSQAPRRIVSYARNAAASNAGA